MLKPRKNSFSFFTLRDLALFNEMLSQKQEIDADVNSLTSNTFPFTRVSVYTKIQRKDSLNSSFVIFVLRGFLLLSVRFRVFDIH